MWHNLSMKKFRFFLYSTLLLAIIVLANFYFVPLGEVTYKYNFSKKYFLGKGFFHKFGPSERIVDNKIIGDPIYFYVNSPRNFSEAKLKIKYKISPEVFEKNEFINIEAGVLLDKKNWRYSLVPIFNNVLLNLANSWDVQTENGLSFYQKSKQFQNYKEFLNNNDFSSAAFYNYNLNFDYFLPNYESQANAQELTIENIRGSYSFYTYLKEESLKIDFSFIDKVNKVRSELSEPKNLSIFVYYQDKLIFSENSSFLQDNSLKYSLNLPSLPEGAYKIEVKVDDNILTKEINTNLSKLTFINRVWLEGQEDGFVLFSNKNNIRIKSLESLCLGEVKINKEIFLIDKIYQQFNIDILDKSNGLGLLNKISSDSCGFLIENSGLFSFSRESFFDPTLKKLEAGIDWEKINFVLADFQYPEKINDYYISEISLDLKNSIKEKDGYNFIISAPFLKNLLSSQYLEIEEMEIKLTGKNLFTKIKEKIDVKFKK